MTARLNESLAKVQFLFKNTLIHSKVATIGSGRSNILMLSLVKNIQLGATAASVAVLVGDSVSRDQNYCIQLYEQKFTAERQRRIEVTAGRKR
jgi:hypothetical protein